MKKIFCMLLCILMAASLLAGCGGSNGEGDGTTGGDLAGAFSVGYGKADISPEYSVYLRGYGEPASERMSTGVAERLYTTCVALTDAKGNSALLISLDLLNSDKGVVQPLRKQLAEKTGVPFDNIMVCCSHNHSGPDISDTVYRALLAERVTEAVEQAMASRKPATMETAFCRPEGFNFVRHYLLIDGTFMGEAVGTVPREQVYGHYGKADNLLQLVRLTERAISLLC